MVHILDFLKLMHTSSAAEILRKLHQIHSSDLEREGTSDSSLIVCCHICILPNMTARAADIPAMFPRRIARPTLRICSFDIYDSLFLLFPHPIRG